MSGWDDDEPAAPAPTIKKESAATSGWADDDGWGSSAPAAAPKAAAADDGWGATTGGDDWGSGSASSSNNNNNRSNNSSSWGGSRPSISAQSMNKGWSVSGGNKRESTDGGSRSGDHSSMNGSSKGGSNPAKLSIPGQIFVDKLTVDVTVTDLRSTFGRFGKITRVTIDYKFDDDRAFAWLSYENELSVDVSSYQPVKIFNYLTANTESDFCNQWTQTKEP